MDTLYLAAICAFASGINRAVLPQLVERLGSARAVFEADAAALKSTDLVTESVINKFISHRSSNLPKKIARFCKQNNVKLVSYADADYPNCLKQIANPPLVLYVKGKLPAADYSIAIVGSRSCTEYGRRAATYFSEQLARCGIPIISGGARGIDTAAHKACLAAGGQTVAVFGCGLDIVYPEENGRLYTEIVAQGGAVITEYAPGVLPFNYNFPARNRIIVGLSQGVLVAEAAKRSGAIITANLAADAGREVYCVPGNIFDRTSIGCHELIRTGAKLIDKPEHILEDKASWELAQHERIFQPSIFNFNYLEQEEKSTSNIVTTKLGAQLLALLQGGALSLEALTEKSGADFASVGMELLELQGAGLIAQNQAQQYYRR